MRGGLCRRLCRGQGRFLLRQLTGQELDAAIARMREQEKEREHREREMIKATAASAEWIDWRALLRAGQDAA